MDEKKVLNKCYPPDFNPAKLPTLRIHRNLNIQKVRIMLPMSIHCNTCSNYIRKGTKFNSIRENVVRETYLFRYYFSCPHCSAELIMKSDPQNLDYIIV